MIDRSRQNAARATALSGGSGADKASGDRAGESTEAEPTTSRRRPATPLGRALDQFQRLGRLRERLSLKRVLSRRIIQWLVVQNGLFIIGIILAIVLIVIAASVAFCTLSGKCTGSTPLQQTNVVTNSNLFLSVLAKAGDKEALRLLGQEEYEAMLAAIEALTVAYPDSASKERKALDQAKKAIEALRTASAAGGPSNPEQLAKLQATVDQAIAELAAVFEGAGQPTNAIGYVAFVNRKEYGANIGEIPTVQNGRDFSSWRGVSQWRRTAGLHAGYDFYTLNGRQGLDPVVVGWPGTIVGLVNWGGIERATAVVYKAPSGKTYRIEYGHMNFVPGGSTVGKPFVRRSGTAIDEAVTIGTTTVQPGDRIGYVARGTAHVDIKWYQSNEQGKITGPAYDWGRGSDGALPAQSSSTRSEATP